MNIIFTFLGLNPGNDDFNTLLTSETKVEIASDIEHEIIGKTVRNKGTSYGVDVFIDRVAYGTQYWI